MSKDQPIPSAQDVDKLISELVVHSDDSGSSNKLDPDRLSMMLKQARNQAALQDNASPTMNEDRQDDGLTTVDETQTKSGDDFQLVIPGYRDLARINQGAQGALYRGVHDKTGRRVAIKVLWGGFLASDAERTRFQRESEVLAELEHPFIVRITDRGRTGTGLTYIVMDLVEGETLDDYLTSHPQVRNNRNALIELFLKIAEAIGAAHEKHVTHRDLKPSNIRIDSHGNPRILDFGLARSERGGNTGATVTTTGQFVGSIPWASPEQVEGRHNEVGATSDVYALGMLLYYMLSGGFPFETRGTTVEVLERIVRSNRVPPSRTKQLGTDAVRLAWIDASLDAIVLRAIAIQPTQRFATVDQLSNALRSYRDQVQSTPRRRMSSSAWAAIIGGAAAVITISLFFLNLGTLGQSPQPNQPSTDAPIAPRDATPAFLNPNEVYGNFGGNEFIAQKDGHLVGLRVWKGHLSEHRVLTGVQPIFRTKDGVVDGTAYGRQTADVEVDIAKEGFAVGGMTLQWGQRIDGLSLQFVPLQAGTAYEGKWLGGKRGENRIDGKGKAAIGLRGRAGAELDAIGLIFEK